MRSTFVWFLLQLASLCSAYSIPGAYERVYYYYAYLIDAEISGGIPGTIATGCIKVMGTGGSKCNFNQFVSFIEGQSSNIYSMAVGADPPNVETAAQACVNAESTGQYEFTRIFNNVSDNPSLFTKLGNWLSLYMSAVDDDTLKTGVRNAGTAVKRTRQAASVGTDIVPLLEENGITAAIRENVPVFDGATQTTTALDMASTVENNDGATVKSVNKVIREWAKNDKSNHAANVDTAAKAEAMINEACGG